MAKLGERVSSSAWIYALGNGLRAEFKESKDGVLYSKPGYQTVLEVKNKLLSEEAVLSSQSQKTSTTHSHDDEIALSTLKPQNPKKSSLKKTDKTVTFTPPPEPETESNSALTDKALWLKGKRGKQTTKGKGKAQPGSWDRTWTPEPTWSPPSKGKGRSKGWDRPPLWCDFHQCYGHSTDWCFDNPNRTGGKPLPNDALWCESCNRSGHTAAMCYATTIRAPQSKGASPSKGGKSKGHYGDRKWKSQNFPANYQSEQASPALHDSTLSSSSQEWWEPHEVGSVTLDYLQPTFFLDDADDHDVASYIDLLILAIQTNMERQQHYTQHPSPQLRQDILDHDALITTTQKCTNIHIQRIIIDFKTSIHYNVSTESSVDIFDPDTNIFPNLTGANGTVKPQEGTLPSTRPHAGELALESAPSNSLGAQ